MLLYNIDMLQLNPLQMHSYNFEKGVPVHASPLLAQVVSHERNNGGLEVSAVVVLVVHDKLGAQLILKIKIL